MPSPPPAPARWPPAGLSRLRGPLLAVAWVGLWLGLWLLSGWLDVHPGISLFYAPAGLTLALLLYLGPRAWPLPLVAGLLPIATLLRDLPATAMLLVTAAHVLVYAASAELLRRWHFHADLSHLRNIALLLIVALLAPIPLALFGTALYTDGDPDTLLTGAFSWWLGDLMGILAITPAALLTMPHLLEGRAATPLPPQAHPWPWTPLAVIGAAILTLTLSPSGDGATQVAVLIIVWGSTVTFAAVSAGIHGTTITSCAAAVLLTWQISRSGAIELALPLQMLLLLTLLSGLLSGAFVSCLRRLQSELEQRVRDGVARASQDRHIFQVVAEHTSDIITIHDANGDTLYISPSIQHLMGHDPEQLLGPPDQHLLSLIHPEDRTSLNSPSSSDFGRLQVRMCDARGHWHWLQCAYNRVSDDGRHERWVAISRDITEQILDRDKLVDLAMHDPLTGLLNRRGLERKGRQEFARASRYDRPLAAMLLDLDHFKSINDRLGHAAGDQILRQMAELLRRHVRNSELICRWGGEEFLVLLPETGLEGARPLAERIRAEAAAQEYLLGDVPVRCTLSCGLTERLPGDEQLENIVRRADEQLYQAKGTGRNRVLG